jgi:hypothetical protein
MEKPCDTVPSKIESYNKPVSESTLGGVPERVHEGEDAWPLLDRLLDHDGDPEGHERLREVSHLVIMK